MNETDENDDENNDNEDSPILREDGGDVGGNPSAAAAATTTTHEEKNPSQQHQHPRGGIDASTKGRIKQEDGYSWTQTEEDVEVNITLPTPGVSAKDIQVAFQPRHVGVTYRGGGGGDQSLLELSLFEAIAVDGSTWTVESKGQTSKVVLVMEKVEQALWSRIYN